MRFSQWMALLVAVVCAGRASAQASISGSESYLAWASSAGSAGGEATSTNYASIVGAGQVATGLRATSTSYTGVGGVPADAAGTVIPVSSGPPALTLVSPPGGQDEGGESITLSGVYIGAGPGLPTVMFGSNPATVLQVVSDHELLVEAPSGEDPTGTSTGGIDVRVITASGEDIACQAYFYHPVIFNDFGEGTLDLEFVISTGETLAGGQPAQLVAYTYGFIPISVPTPNLDGTLFVLPLETILAVPSGGIVIFDPAAISSSSSLVGLQLIVQATTITDIGTSTGELTNPLAFTIE